MSPDIFSSLACACIARRVVVTDYPLTIPGRCSASNSVIQGALKAQSTKLEDQPEIRDIGYRWSDVVPRLYTGPGIWADSAVAALLAMGRSDLVRQLNLPKLAAHCIEANRGVTRRVLKDSFKTIQAMGRSQIIHALRLALYLLTVPCVKFARRAINRILMIIGVRRTHRDNNAVNMVQVSNALTNYLREHGQSFSDCVLQIRLNAPGDRR
jgi:hypothetical protein